MRLLVTGAAGQLARKLGAASNTGVSVVATGRPALDITVPGTIAAAIAVHRPDIVVNAAAYTAVDKAESEPDQAFAVNRDGAGNVAAAACAADLPVIHISTDYVFAGDKQGAYVEDDETRPMSVYGKSKLAGEAAVAAVNPRHVILRTAWVYSDTGGNFVRTMLRLAGERDEIAVVADQFGNPTSAADLVEGVLRVARRLVSGDDFGDHGVFHLAGTGRTNWADFARHVFAVSGAIGGPSAKVRDIATADYPTAAKRPLNSCLSTDGFAGQFGWRPPEWRASAEAVVKSLVVAAR
ncbi:MAG: dTDP-4-dehydrorhamnose reductase [Rhizobiaceae bacterium]